MGVLILIPSSYENHYLDALLMRFMRNKWTFSNLLAKVLLYG